MTYLVSDLKLPLFQWLSFFYTSCHWSCKENMIQIHSHLPNINIMLYFVTLCEVEFEGHMWDWTNFISAWLTDINKLLQLQLNGMFFVPVGMHLCFICFITTLLSVLCSGIYHRSPTMGDSRRYTDIVCGRLGGML